MNFFKAIVRRPGPNLGDGLSTGELGAPDYARALQQHACYVQALEEAGLDVTVLEPLPDFPDAYFVEDVAVVVPELAVIARPGAPERRGETEAMESVLAAFRRIARIEDPGTLDGGDVLVAGKRVFIGVSRRTNQEGARQFATLLGPIGYQCVLVPVDVGLHLKSNVNWVRDNTLLMTRGMARGEWGLGSGEWLGAGDMRSEIFAGFRQIVVDEDDEFAANVLAVNKRLLMPTQFPRVRTKLERLGMPIVELDVSEMRKRDGGLTCMSLRF